MDFLRTLTIIAVLAGMTALPVLIAWMVILTDRVREGVLGVRARFRPSGHANRSVESMMDGLDRVRDDLRALPLSAVEERGVLSEEYDARLLRACAVVGVDHRLTEVTGLDLELERLRATEALHVAASSGRGRR